MVHYVRTLTILLWTLWLLALLCPTQTAAGSVPTTAPTTQPVDQDAMVLLKSLQTSRLRLSTDNNTATDKFSLRFILHQKTVGRTQLQLQAFIVRRADRVAILVMSFDGLPYCYMTKGLVLAVDDENPGGLVRCDVGCPNFTWTADPKTEQVTANISFDRKLAAPHVEFDFARYSIRR